MTDNLFEQVVSSSDENQVAWLESKDILQKGSDRRFYLATKVDEDLNETLVGIFSNRKPMMGALYKVGIEDTYLSGKKTRKKVTAGSIGLSFKNKIVKIYREVNGEEMVAFKIREITLNRMNPEFFE